MIKFTNKTKNDSVLDFANMVFKNNYFDPIRNLQNEIEIVFEVTSNVASSTELCTDMFNTRMFVKILLAPSVMEIITHIGSRYNKKTADFLLLEVFFHEMVHARQFIEGRLRVDASASTITGVTFWDEYGKHSYSIEELKKNNTDPYNSKSSLAKKMRFAHEWQAIEETKAYTDRLPQPSNFQLQWVSAKLVFWDAVNKHTQFIVNFTTDKTVVCQDETQYNNMIKEFFK